MAGLSVESGSGGGRRALDSELNMIPMIDLLMVTISFLLITAVWSTMGRVNASAQVPGAPDPSTPITEDKADKSLHVEMLPEKFIVTWRQGKATVDSFDVPRKGVTTIDRAGLRLVRYPELATRLGDTWKTAGVHRATSDRTPDRAVLHAENTTAYSDMIAALDAIKSVEKDKKTSAFEVTFAAN
jgi:biopolymer transport protein ExbD